ncbi:MAG: Zn-binding domain-containing protein, partial [Candidatus Nitrosotenuis sp.]
GAIGGNGASKALYDRLEKAFERSLFIVKECPCTGESGCPRCTFSYRCGNNNEFLHKKASLEILQRINNGERLDMIEPAEGDRPLV